MPSTGQTRANDRYTMQHSYIASNATGPRWCLQAATKTPLDPTTTEAHFEGNSNNL